MLTYNEEVEKLKVKLNLCKAALASGRTDQVMATHNVDALKLKTYYGTRKARKINNFLWNMERYFDAVGINEEAEKVHNLFLYLNNIAQVWWRRSSDDVKKGKCFIDTWKDFKRKLRKQFYPEDAKNEARTKLRCLQHKESYIREYVKEFSELLLEISDMGEKDAENLEECFVLH